MALQDLTMMLPSRLDCPLSLKTPNMGNTGLTVDYAQRLMTVRRNAPPVNLKASLLRVGTELV